MTARLLHERRHERQGEIDPFRMEGKLELCILRKAGCLNCRRKRNDHMRYGTLALNRRVSELDGWAT